MTDSPHDTEPVTAIRNIGPAQAEGLARAGITTARALRDMGADAAYRAMINSGQRLHFIGYYSLVMGLQGRPWNDCKGAEKDVLRARFDTLVAAQAGDHSVELFLDAIGTGRRR